MPFHPRLCKLLLLKRKVLQYVVSLRGKRDGGWDGALYSLSRSYWATWSNSSMLPVDQWYHFVSFVAVNSCTITTYLQIPAQKVFTDESRPCVSSRTLQEVREPSLTFPLFWWKWLPCLPYGSLRNLSERLPQSMSTCLSRQEQLKERGSEREKKCETLMILIIYCM